MWKCPACHTPLSLTDKRWQCDNAHSFDQAKEGYVNLLLAQHKRSKDPGDNKEMIAARRTFLEGDFYLPLAKYIAKTVNTYCDSASINVFDAGCGEGYYLSRIVSGLGNHKLVSGAGIDISKFAIQKAAKKYKEQQFSVASCFQIPIESDWSDAVIQIFAPSSDEEVQRVLKPGGVWIQVNPGPGHLRQIKQMIYAETQSHQTNTTIPAGFSLLSEEQVDFDFVLTEPDARISLLKMTPFYWSTPLEKIESIQNLLCNVSAEFHVRVLQKDA